VREDPGELRADPLHELRQRSSSKWRTYPRDVLPLTVAEMDYPLAIPIATALREAIDRSDTGYATARSGLGDALAGFADRRWGWQIDPSGVTAVTDVGAGVVELLRALADPGAGVVINSPVYPPFFDWVPEAKTSLVRVPLAHDEEGWRLDLAALESAFASGPSVYVLCNPHNPVGRVHTLEELAAVVGLARRYGVTIVSDEIHAPLVLRGATFTPVLAVPGAAEVAVSVVSASKAWNLAGLKCAMVVAGSPTMNAVVDRFPPEVRWRTGHLGVIAAIAAFEEGESWLDELLVTLEKRRSDLRDLLVRDLAMVRWHPPEATFLAWLDCRAIGSGDEPRDLFLERGRVALEPGLRFGPEGDGYVRLNFATSPELLVDAISRMAGSFAAGCANGP
jgi:cysteine-S-conjugate beta-lyase